MIHSSITEFIHFFRSQQVKSKLHRGLVQLAIGSIIFLFAMGLLESVFYFTIPVRLKTAEFFLLLFCTAISFIYLRWLFHYKSFFKNSSNEFLAQNFEKRNPKIGDRLLNALQLEKLLDDLDKGKDLAEFAVSKLNTELKNISRESLYDPVSKSLKKTLRITLISAVIILLLLINSLPHAFQRLLQPSKDTEAGLFIDLATQSGLYLNAHCQVKTTPSKAFSRSLMRFSLVNTLPELTSLCIKNDNNRYSDDYIALCKAFYLKM